MDYKNKAIVFFVVIFSVLLIYWSTSLSADKDSIKKNVVDTSEHTEEKYREALTAETQDPCATPEGYTDESWRDHMGHHPAQYEECL